MIRILIHGDDITASRNRLNEIRTRYEQFTIVILDGKTIAPEKWARETRSEMLFSNEKILIVENFSASNLLKKADFGDNNVILWEGKILTPAVLKSLSAVFKIELFKQNPLIFQLVDSIIPGKIKICLKLLQDTAKIREAELIFGMIVRQFRLLILVKDTTIASKTANADDLAKLAPWQMAKLKNQAKYFTAGRLLNIYDDLFRIDLKLKTGHSALSLQEALDIFLIKHLK